jgi:hypothetical protein
MVLGHPLQLSILIETWQLCDEREALFQIHTQFGAALLVGSEESSATNDDHRDC